MNIDYYKSFLDNINDHIVICDLNHIIIYMNKCAVNKYAKHGGGNLVGKSLKDCHNAESGIMIDKAVEWFKKDINNNSVFTYYNPKYDYDTYIVALRDDNNELIGYYEKHEVRTRESKMPYQDFKESLD